MATKWNDLFKRSVIKVISTGSENYTATINQLTLAEAVNKIDRLFGCDRLLKEFDLDITIPYYAQSELGYKIFHSGEDAIHLALNPDGLFNPDGYYAQPRIVAEQIRELAANNVLELGCGKGFNSCYLAEQYPGVKFTGIDLTPLHIKIANRKVQGFSNLNFQLGNFNQLSFADRSFDVVFAFDCLCHATEAKLPLAEIFRVLRPGGRLIVFDGYRRNKLEEFPNLMQTATKLTEVSMAVSQGFAEIDDWIAIAQSIGFKVQEKEDVSKAIEPSALKLQKLALKFFKSSWRAKILTYLLPKYLIINSVAGLLMPFVIDSQIGACGYYKLLLER